MRALDDLLPEYDWSERYVRRVAAAPHDAVAALLAAPAAPDRVVQALLRLRGLHAEASIADSFTGMRFEQLHRSPVESVFGATAAPWRLRARPRPFGAGGPGTVRIAVDLRAEPVDGGCLLSTETRIAAADDDARRAFRRYWFVVRPFSGLIRRRWLAAAEELVSRQ